MSLTSWASRLCSSGADNLQQVDNMCMMRSTVGGHPLLGTILSVCGNGLWRIVASQLRNSAVISHRIPAPCCTKLSWSSCYSGNCAPGGCQSNSHQNTKQSAWSQHWHFCSGTMMTVTSFWTRSSQMMKRGLHTLSQKPSSSQYIGVTMDLPARQNSSRLRRHGKWCVRCSRTEGSCSS